MVSVGPDGTCQWKSGSIQKHSDHITSSSGSSATTFRLFDHITVSHTNTGGGGASRAASKPDLLSHR